MAEAVGSIQRPVRSAPFACIVTPFLMCAWFLCASQIQFWCDAADAQLQSPLQGSVWLSSHVVASFGSRSHTPFRSLELLGQICGRGFPIVLPSQASHSSSSTAALAEFLVHDLRHRPVDQP